jgi:transcriptional regulator with XRE-family HTH domain
MPRRPSPDTTTIGQRIQGRRLLRGWSVRYAASRAGLSHATWSRIERGLQAADNRFLLADVAAALECSPADLAGVPVPAADRRAAEAQLGVYGIRQALIDIDLADPGTRPARPLPELRASIRLLMELRRGCDYAGVARLLPNLLRELHAAAGHDAERDGALRLLCAVTFVASSALRSLGCPGDAWLGAERCRSIAEATGDPVLLAHAAIARGLAATACGSLQRSLSLTERAVDALRPHTGAPGGLETLGILSLTGAYASRGLKRQDDSRAWLAQAGELAARTGETTTMELFFGPTNVNIWRIGLEADGGDPGAAIAVARDTNPAVIDAGCRQVFYYTDAARAYANVGGADREALRYLLIAERIAPQHVHSSAFVQETARSLLDRARRQAGGTALRGLCERMGVTG